MSTTPSTFITNMYANVLRRTTTGAAGNNVTTAELLSWDTLITSKVLTEAQVTTAFVNSTEATNNVNPIIRMYQTFYNRVPDAGGLDFWAGRLRSGASTLAQISNAFSGAAEFKTLYGDASATNADAFVTALYTNVLGRPGDAGGISFWKSQYLAQGANPAAAAAVANAFAGSQEFITNSGTTITTLLTSLASGGTMPTGPLGGTSGTTTGSSFNLTTSADNLTGTSSNDTFTADDSANVQSSAADSINGGSGTDTFKHYLAGAAAAVVNPSLTSIEGLYISGGAAVTADFSTLTGVTSVTLDNLGGAANYTLTASQLLTIQNDNGATVRNVTAIYGATDASTTITLAGVGKTGGAATLDVQGAALKTLALVSSSTSNNISLTNTGGVLATVNVSGDKALTLTENLAAIKTINAGTATGNITADVSTAALASTFAFTGGTGNDNVKIGATQVVKTMTLDGGAGADTLTIADTSIAANQASGINAAKNFEILAFSSTAAYAADLSLVTGITQFSFAGATSTAGAAGAAGNAGGPGTAASGVAVAITNQTNAQTFTFDAGIAANGGAGGASTGANVGGAGAAGAKVITFAPAVDNGTNTLNLTFAGVTLNSSGGAGGAGGTGNQNGGAGGNGAITIDAATFETVNITSNANSSGSVTTNTLNAAGGAGGALSGTGTAGAAGTDAAGLNVNTNATVNISGAAAFSAGIIAGTNVTVNAGALTGNLTVTTQTGADAITGGSGVNKITLLGGVDTVDLAKSTAKADVITISAATNTTSTGFVKISGFTNAATTGDQLDIAGSNTALAGTGATLDFNAIATGLTGSVSSAGVLSFGGSAASTATLANKVSAAFGAAVLNNVATKEVIFEHGGNTYIAVELGTGAGFTAGTDYLVELTGVTGATGIGNALAAGTVFVG